MNTKRVIKQLKKKYPGKKIIVNTPDDPTEIICEIEATQDHPDYSLAIAVIGRIRPHYHKKLTETYKVMKGDLKHYMDGKLTLVKEGEIVKISPGVIHWAEGVEVWFEVFSKPGWTPEDHILVFDEREVSRKDFDKD